MMDSKINRKGAAAFELSLSLPLLFTMIILITWQGLSMIGLSQVTIAARHVAWKKRFDDPPGTALVFVRGEILEDADLVDSDLVVGEAESSHKISPIVEQMPTPKSQLSLMAGSWDHRQLPLEDIPNWRQYLLMAASAKLGGAQTNLAQLQDALGKLENLAGDMSKEQQEQLDDLQGNLDDLEKGENEEQAKAREQLQEKIRLVDERIAALNAELEENEERLKALWPDFDKDKDENSGGPPPSEGDDEKDVDVSTEIQLLLNQRARINSQLRTAEREKATLEQELAEL